jgi:hypothetical protein
LEEIVLEEKYIRHEIYVGLGRKTDFQEKESALRRLI